MHTIRLLLALHVNYQFARDSFLGVAEEAQTYGNIVTRLKLPHESLESAASALRAHAIIAAPATAEEHAELLAKTDMPKICIANLLETHDVLPVVGNDDRAVGRMAADYFQGAGFKHFAYFANSSTAYFVPRKEAFVEALREGGHHCFEGPAGVGDERVTLDQLTAWLVGLPKPVAVFAAYDGYAREVINACKVADLSVPETVSVIGVDNDAVECLSTTPSISSVATSAHEIGRQALNLVLAMLRGEPPPPGPVLIAPRALVIRESCGERAVEDEDVAAAVNFIRRNMRERITVSKIANGIAISPRTLQRKFEEVLHRSPIDEIRRARIAHAKRLLAETDLGLMDVARRSGMIRVQRLAKLIKQDTGLTPLQLRKSHREQQ